MHSISVCRGVKFPHFLFTKRSNLVVFCRVIHLGISSFHRGSGLMRFVRSLFSLPDWPWRLYRCNSKFFSVAKAWGQSEHWYRSCLFCAAQDYLPLQTSSRKHHKCMHSESTMNRYVLCRLHQLCVLFNCFKVQKYYILITNSSFIWNLFLFLFSE